MGDSLTKMGNAFIFAFAGHDTTGHTLTWLVFELCRHPHHQRRLSRLIETTTPAEDSLTKMGNAFIFAFAGQTFACPPAGGYEIAGPRPPSDLFSCTGVERIVVAQ